jgi:hypothetical protein
VVNEIQPDPKSGKVTGNSFLGEKEPLKFFFKIGCNPTAMMGIFYKFSKTVDENGREMSKILHRMHEMKCMK